MYFSYHNKYHSIEHNIIVNTNKSLNIYNIHLYQYLIFISVINVQVTVTLKGEKNTFKIKFSKKVVNFQKMSIKKKFFNQTFSSLRLWVYRKDANLHKNVFF